MISASPSFATRLSRVTKAAALPKLAPSRSVPGITSLGFTGLDVAETAGTFAGNAELKARAAAQVSGVGGRVSETTVRPDPRPPTPDTRFYVLADDSERYPRIDLAALPPHDLVVLPDEPYAFSPTDGPDAFPGAGSQKRRGCALCRAELCRIDRYESGP